MSQSVQSNLSLLSQLQLLHNSMHNQNLVHLLILQAAAAEHAPVRQRLEQEAFVASYQL